MKYIKGILLPILILWASFDLTACERGYRNVAPAEDRANSGSASKRIALLYAQGRDQEAETLARGMVDSMEHTASPDRLKTALALKNLAFLYENRGSYHKALPLYNRVRSIYEAKLGPYHPVTCRFLDYLATFHINSGAFSKAERLLENPCPGSPHREIPGLPEVPSDIPDLIQTPRGAAFVQMRNFYRQAWQFLFKGKYEKAVEAAEKGLALSEQLDSPVGIVDGLNVKGYLIYKRGYYEKALELRDRALGVAKKATYAFGLGRNLSSVGSCYFRLGNLPKAKSYYEQSLAVRREIGNLNEIARAQNDLANVHQLLGNYWKALGLRKEALALWRETGNRIGIADGLNDMGWLFEDVGDYDQALKHLQEARDLHEAVQEMWGLADSIDHIGLIHYKQGKYDRALEAFRKAYTLFETMGNREEMAQVKNHIAEALHSLKHYLEAERAYCEALELTREVLGSRHPRYAMVLHNLALLYLDTGRFVDSERLFHQTLETLEDTYELRPRILVLHHLGSLQRRQNRPLQALGSYRQALALLETLYTGLEEASQEIKTAFLGQFSSLYRQYIDLLFELHNQDRKGRYNEEAFTASEKARSRVFLEMITEARAAQSFAENSNDPVLSGLLRQERDLLLQMHAAQRELALQKQNPVRNKGPSLIRTIQERIRRIETRYRDVQQKLETQYPRYVDLKKPQPLTLLEARKVLHEDEAVLSYFVTQYHTGIWVITREGAQMVVLPLGQKDLRSRIETMRKSFSSIPETLKSSSFSELDLNPAYELYQTLLAPVAHWIESKKTLYIAPDDALYKLPLEILTTRPYGAEPKGGVPLGAELQEAPFLVNTHNLSYLPSVSVLRSLRAFGKSGQASQRTLVAFADPVFDGEYAEREKPGISRGILIQKFQDSGAIRAASLPPLPDTREEALYIAGVLGVSLEEDVYLGLRASETNVKRLPLDRYRNLLFSTHGLLAGEFKLGLQPALALSFVGDPQNDGLLEMGEILGLKLNADLVVLSACNTGGGTGRNDHGEGFAGLTRSFMFAGARSLLVTQWSVESSTARMLMEKTFLNYEKRGKALSLAEAKRSLIQDPAPVLMPDGSTISTAHPFFWAPFILVGEAN